MSFIDECKAQLTHYLGLNAEQLQAERLLVTVDGTLLNVEFYSPEESVSIYSIADEAIVGPSAGLSAYEEYMLLRQALQTNAELFEHTMVRICMDGDRLGVIMNCSPLNCPGPERFGDVLRQLLQCRATLQSIT